jgi:catalase
MTNKTVKNAKSDFYGNGEELHQQAAEEHKKLTTNQGVIISDNQNSLKYGAKGPTLLEDFILREKIMHFDHERIPERIVHARGAGAHGYFKLNQSLSEYTTADIFTKIGKKVPLFCRISTVAGGSGSVDTPRDVRGFAVKFYTSQGNWDLVGNNIPVFFIQDAIKFPDLIHAVKMEPDRGYPQAASAHDTFWDFISLTPESMHMIMWAMSDRAIPRSLRMIEGFGIHSFRLINAEGISTFVKFHWRPKLGLQSTLWDEAVKLQSADNDYLRRDLYEAIEQGDYPEWDLGVQLFTEKQAEQFPFDHLDPTKLIPEELVPLKIIGTMVLDRNPDNFFAETEQVAFCPSHILPGMDFSNDPLLQGRLFSYLDTQLSRLGSPNFNQLPINAPKCPFSNHQRDGHMQMHVPKGRVSYEPNSLSKDSPQESSQGFRSFNEGFNDAKGRVRNEEFADHYSQAKQFYLSQSKTEQSHIANAIVFELSKVETAEIRERVVSHLLLIDKVLAHKVSDGIGLDELPRAFETKYKPKNLPVSPSLQLIGKMKKTLKGRTVGLLFGEGSDENQINKIVRSIKKEGATCKLVARKIGGFTMSNGNKLKADMQIEGAPSVIFDSVVGVLSIDTAKKYAQIPTVNEWFMNAYVHLKGIGYDAGTKIILDKIGIFEDEGVSDITNLSAFLTSAKTRNWVRENKFQ